MSSSHRQKQIILCIIIIVYCSCHLIYYQFIIYKTCLPEIAEGKIYHYNKDIHKFKYKVLWGLQYCISPFPLMLISILCLLILIASVLWWLDSSYTLLDDIKHKIYFISFCKICYSASLNYSAKIFRNKWPGK